MATAKEKKAERDAAKAAGAPTEIDRLNAENFAGRPHPGSGPALPQTRTRQYVVGCKLGVAYYRLQHTPLVEKQQQGQQGMRTVMEAEPTGPIVTLRGTAYPRGTVPEGFPPAPLIVDGAALNYGIDADWFDEWLRQHAKDPLVINGLIFARENEADVRAIAKENAAVKSGLDPVNPKGDPRISKSTRGEIANVAPADRKAS